MVSIEWESLEFKFGFFLFTNMYCREQFRTFSREGLEGVKNISISFPALKLSFWDFSGSNKTTKSSSQTLRKSQNKTDGQVKAKFSNDFRKEK